MLDSITKPFTVKAVVEGRGRIAGMVGHMECEGESGKCLVGAGFQGNERTMFWVNREYLVGRTILVKYHPANGKIYYPVLMGLAAK